MLWVPDGSRLVPVRRDDYRDGLLLGIVTGNTLTLTWMHGTPNANMGTAQFVLSADGRSFTGTWVSPTWSQQGTWTGTRR